MRTTIGIALRLALATLVLTGVVYPLAVTGVSHLLFPRQAEGSLLRRADGTVLGSTLIGQTFSRPGYFHSRPSAAGTGYDATSSGGSNLGPTSIKLRARAVAEIVRLQTENPDAPLPIPADLVTASASGLDPHISVAAALWQAPRVARARGMDERHLRQLIADATEGRTLGFLGEPRVNVVKLNLALEENRGQSPFTYKFK